MKETKDRIGAEREPIEALRTYLHDHTAGAEHAVGILEALTEVHAGTALGEFAVDLLLHVETDLTALKRLAADVGAEGYAH